MARRVKPTSLKTLLAETQQALQPISETSRLEAELLITHIFNQPKSYLYTHPEALIEDEAYLCRLNSLVQRRLAKEPLAYLLGEKEFWMHTFEVNPATLIPRPETECLIELVLSHFSNDEVLHVADLGTGCGAIALSLAAAKTKWVVTATDLSTAALQVARRNASRFQLGNVYFMVSDWCQALRPNSQDIITSNPPYISEAEWHLYQADLAYEPPEALLSGPQGLNDIIKLADSARKVLKKGGYLFIEHGYQQGKAVRTLFNDFSYCNIQTLRDLGGHERITHGQWFSIG